MHSRLSLGSAEFVVPFGYSHRLFLAPSDQVPFQRVFWVNNEIRKVFHTLDVCGCITIMNMGDWFEWGVDVMESAIS